MNNIENTPAPADKYTKFRKDLEHLINRNSMENGSDTPDFILAAFLADSLAAFDKAVEHRALWYGHKTQPVPSVSCPHCGSEKDAYFSRVEPMGDYCPDCGKERV